MKCLALLFSCLVLLSAPMARAEDSSCKSVDFSNAPGFADRKELNQLDNGWCLPFSLANLVSQKLGKAVSPYDIAIRTNALMNHPINYYGARVSEISDLFKAQPWFCEEKNYSTNFLWNLSLVSQSDLFLALKQNSQRLCSDPIVKSAAVFNSQSIFANIQDSDEVLKAVLNSDDAGQYLKELNDTNCKNKIQASIELEFTPHICNWSDENCTDQSMDDLKTRLDSGRMAVATIDPLLLFHNNETFLDAQVSHLHFAGQHAVTVVGKSFHDNHCYFKIRDSAFGRYLDCANIRRTPAVHCIDNDKMDYEVPEELLKKAIVFVTSIKN